MREVVHAVATVLFVLGLLIAVSTWITALCLFIPMLVDAAMQLEGPAVFVAAQLVAAAMIIIGGVLGSWSEGPTNDNDEDEL